MEFPHLGTHCSLPECNQLDFLPFKCEACGKIFCKEHYSYAKHNCPNVKDRTVPTCPVCGNAVALMGRDESVDEVVNRHIENDCALGRKNTKLKCQVKGCKEKEFVKVECQRCHRNFCLRHRHPADHACDQFLHHSSSSSSNHISKPGSAALARANDFFNATASLFNNNKATIPHQQQQPSQHMQQATTTMQRQRVTAQHVHSLQQPGLSEEEALRIALEKSIPQQQHQHQQPQQQHQHQQPQQQQQETENDEDIARALQEDEYLTRIPAVVPTSPSKPHCSLS